MVPRSSRSEFVGIYNNLFKIKLKAPPIDGEANKELISFVSSRLKIPKSNIEITLGEKQKRKTLKICGINSKEALEIIKTS